YRLDDMIHFDPLSIGDLVQIVDLQIAQLAKRLSQRRLRLEVTPAAAEWLARVGSDPAYGARPLRRLVQREIGDNLAKQILAGQRVDGDTVEVDADGEGITLKCSGQQDVAAEPAHASQRRNVCKAEKNQLRSFPRYKRPGYLISGSRAFSVGGQRFFYEASSLGSSSSVGSSAES